MWPLFLTLCKKQDAAELDLEPIPKVCRVCWGEDEDGEEKWVAPCRCPRAIAWVHRPCLEWRFKHMPSEEDKLRCDVCKYAYKKGLRLKSFREWCNGAAFLFCDLAGLLYALCALLIFRGVRATLLKLNPWWLGALVLVYFNVSIIAFLILIHVGDRQPEQFGLPLYKRFLAVADCNWVFDAPPPQRSSPSTTS